MKRLSIFWGLVILLAFGGCSSEAPPAPIGLDRRPANPEPLAAATAADPVPSQAASSSSGAH